MSTNAFDPLENALTALKMIRDNEHGESWSAGVAVSALASIEEGGYPQPCLAPGFENDPYTMGTKLCDDDGIVRRGAMHHGTDYTCTGHAHFGGEHIECLSPAHNTTPLRVARATKERVTVPIDELLGSRCGEVTMRLDGLGEGA